MLIYNKLKISFESLLSLTFFSKRFGQIIKLLSQNFGANGTGSKNKQKKGAGEGK